MRAFAPPRTLAHLRTGVGAGVSINTLLSGALVAVALGYLGAFVIAAVFRLSYPFPLHPPSEPASLAEVDRVRQGLPLYVAPTLAHAPLIYGPVYTYLSAAASYLVGDTFAAVRLVSLLASLATLAVIARLVQRETNSPAAGLLAAGLYAATYPLTETALDLGRVDALFTLCLFAAIYAARRPSFDANRPGLWIAAGGLAVGLAAITKIPLGAAPLGLTLLLYIAFAHPRHLPIYVAMALLVPAVVLALLRIQSGPWPTWYLWDLPRLHDLRTNLIGRFWWADLLPHVTIALVLGPVFLLTKLLQRDPRPLVLYGLVSPSLLVLSWLSRSNAGGAPNVLLPAFGISAVLLGLGFHAAAHQLDRAKPFQAYVFGVCLLQFALLLYNPRLTVPYRSDQWADEALSARLAALPGPIFAPDLDGYVRGTVNGPQPMTGPLDEVRGAYGGPGTPEGRAIDAELERALDDRRFRFVVVYEDDRELKSKVMAHGYTDAGPLFPPGDVFYEWKTWRTPEVHLYAAPGER